MGDAIESQPTLNDLAAKISELSQTFTKFMDKNKIAAPTFAADSPTSYTGLDAEAFVLKGQLLDALSDMWILAQGPSESIFNYCHSAMPDASCLSVLNHFDFWAAVPVDRSASYSEISKKVELPEDVVRRVIEHATTLRIFAETVPGSPTTRIVHTSRSAALAKSPGLKALVSTLLDDAGAPSMVLSQALEKYTKGRPQLTEKMSETSFAMLHKGEYANSWDYIENDGEGEQKGWRQRNFVTFMSYLKDMFHLENLVADSVDWTSFGEAHVVDIGGSAGHDSFVLARKFPQLSFTVQDLPQVAPVFDKMLPEDLKSRVSFSKHDMFQPQPVHGADIYMLKLIMHDYPDSEAIKIIRSQIPAMKRGSKLLIIEYIKVEASEDAEGKTASSSEASKPAEAVPRTIKNYGTATDLRMMTLFNAKERVPAEYPKLVKAADERFEVTKVIANPMTFFVVVEAEWRG
ncbi:O-methyltransferase-domain-containing protein [Microdochium trichocladiopsis]|uniref:O-methyltransferase-domain-containing protein n=1 Tax=Microdochium trichocladiopsis TaxID=1682393 RepID=A0A9P8Y8C7_9PEZI|nr:O-methyltransferase-domain-containing protein [Microdochium trichocladiopsis]KAH7032987.1 O-methyltransferase-domain-containing protein [Microdochium trichocladiopsis]